MRDTVQRMRRFNRFYTGQIGVLSEHLLSSDYSLTEVRVLYEIANREQAKAAEIAGQLRLDRGYLSRILHRFHKEGLLARAQSRDDGRESYLSLTSKGRRVFGSLDARQSEEVAALLHRISVADQQRLTGAMRTIEEVLGPHSKSTPSFLLREPHPGDLGWIVHRHGALYAQEYHYDERFEALVATIVGQFVEHYDPKRERCWVAEKDGEVAGSVFLVRKSEKVAKLRLLYVEPNARGLGIGERLVNECVRFARQAGYRKITLWTQSELHAARRLYEKAGFVRVKEVPHKSFGRDDLVSETWDVELDSLH
jgi:DNA-binding MarR family transcriptional regulator/N-acetylglutamate synthase-like GNAT family acetyltransferase